MAQLVVDTVHGRVRGEMRGGAAAWKGIPYAAPPVRGLRFRPPRPPTPWTGERNATHFAPVAPQSRDPVGAMLSGVPAKVAMDEDCLALNVFSPAGAGGKRPVVVFLHGGAFIMGSGSTPLYDGASFAARHDLVVVTINYRLGLLGLLYLGDLCGAEYAEGNCALLDQIAALGWVQGNIASFGGDPDSVTVMGQSAGAISLGTLLAMPAARGLFHRAILQSGASGLLVPTRADATGLAERVLAELAIDRTRIELLADVPLERLLAVQDKLGRRSGLGVYAPYIDGVTLPDRPIDIIRAGRGARVPLLAGSNRDEWTLFDVLLGSGTTEHAASQLRKRLGDAVDRIHAVYREARADGSPAGAWVDLVGDAVFRIPMIHLAEAESGCGAPVWMYRFDWATPAFDGRLGAAHAIDLPFVWNQVALPVSQLLLGGDASAQPLATRMNDAWASFIRSGDPNGAGLPPWPTYEPSRRSTMLLDREPSVAGDPGGERRAAWAAV